MATGRKVWFKVADSVADEAWTNDELAMMVRLSALMHSRWRANRSSYEEASKITLSTIDQMKVSGKRRPDVARTSLGHLADIATISVGSNGDVMWIEWPKWATFQGPESGSRVGAGPKHAPSEAEAEAEAEDRILSGKSPTLPSPRKRKPKEQNTDAEKGLLDVINRIGKRNYIWTETSEHRRYLQRILRQTPMLEEIEAVLRHRFEFWSATPEMLQYFRPATLAAHWDDYRAQASAKLEHIPKNGHGPDLNAGFQAWDRVVLPELRRGVLHRRVEIADQRVAQALRSIGGLRTLGESPAAMLPRKRSDFAAAFALIPAASQPLSVEKTAHG